VLQYGFDVPDHPVYGLQAGLYVRVFLPAAREGVPSLWRYTAHL